MSSNLLKGFFTSVSPDDARVIDTNELVRKRIEELSDKMQQSANKGFVSGLNASKVEVPTELFEDEEQPNVIKQEIFSQKEAEELKMEADRQANEIIARANKEAEGIIQEAKKEAELLKTNAQRDIEKQSKDSYSQAMDQGYNDGLAKAEKELEKNKLEYDKMCEELESEYQRMVDNLEPMFVDTITGIYEHIFHVELKSYKEILLYLISTTMRKVEGDRNFIVHVSKEDYPYISMQKKQIAAGATTANNSVDIIEDLTLSKNECFIETDGGIFDCGLGTQLTELAERLEVLSYKK